MRNRWGVKKLATGCKSQKIMIWIDQSTVHEALRLIDTFLVPKMMFD